MSSSSPAARGPVGVAVLLGLVGLVLAWGVATAVSLLGAAGDLREARADLVAAERSLRDAELRVARGHLDAGVVRATSASDRLARPWVRVLRVVPVAGPNLRAVTALSDTARDAGGAASDLLAAADTIVRDEREQRRGEISLAYLADLRGPLRALADALEVGLAEVEAVDHDRLIGLVADQRDAFLELARPAASQAETGAQLVEAMPAFLGEDRPRRYLVGAMSLSELRATGGLFGSWSVLTTDGGYLDVDEFRPIDDLPDLADDVEPPSASFAQRYGRFGSLRVWRNVNLSPDLPEVAQATLALWEAGGREPLDGVVLVDPVALARLLGRVGPVEVPGITTLEPEDALGFVTLDAYAAFDDDDERKRVLGHVATLAFASMLDLVEDSDVPASVEVLSDLAAGDHVRVHVRDGEVQDAFDRAGVGSVLPDDAGPFTAVAVNNVAGSKVDVFTDRHIEQHVEVTADGEVITDTLVTFINDAPREGYPRHVLGPWTDTTEAGDNLSEVTVLCGQGCRFTDLPDEAREEGFVHGLPAADLRLHVPAGADRQVRWVTRTPAAWVDDGDGIELRLRHWLQPTVRPTQLEVRVSLPEGLALRDRPDDAEVDGGTLRWRTSGSGGRELSLRLTPTVDGPS